MNTRLSVRDLGHVINIRDLGQVRHLALSLKSIYSVNGLLTNCITMC